MKTEYLHKDKKAPVGIIFGGNPEMMDHVIQTFEKFDRLTVFGTLSEEEGIKKMKSLPNMDFVLIGGRYSLEQRIRIRKTTEEYWPKAFTTEPGIQYVYGEQGILNDLIQKLEL